MKRAAGMTAATIVSTLPEGLVGEEISRSSITMRITLICRRSQLSKSGNSTSLRRPFATIWVNECYRDLSPIDAGHQFWGG